MSTRILVIDAVVAAIVYCIHLLLAITLLYKIYTYTHRPHRYKHLILVSTLLILGTIEVSAYLYFNRAGGLQRLLDFLQRQFSSAESGLTGRAETGTSSKGLGDLRRTDITLQYVNGLAALSITYVANGYMLYRCFVIWSHSSARFVVLLPFLLYLAILGNGAFGIYNLTRPNNWHDSMIFLRLQWALSLSTNALISFFIVARLLLIRRRAIRTFGNCKERRKAYTGVIAVLGESSLLYTLVVGVAYPLYGPTAFVFEHTGTTENMVNPLLAQIECIAAEIIVLRFVQGRAWTGSSAREVTTRGDLEHRLSAPAFAVNPNLQADSQATATWECSSLSGAIELQLMPESGSSSQGKLDLEESKCISSAKAEELVLVPPQIAHRPRCDTNHRQNDVRASTTRNLVAPLVLVRDRDPDTIEKVT